MSDVNKKCQHCQITRANLRNCTGCYAVFYCSKQCQRSDWPSHKNACSKYMIGSDDQSRATLVSEDKIMDTVNTVKYPEATQSSCSAVNVTRETDDTVHKETSNNENTGYEARKITSEKKTKGTCMACRKPFCTMMCAKCIVNFYCSKACQKKDWPIHKKYCKKVNDTRMPTKNSALTTEERIIIENMKVRAQRFNEEGSRYDEELSRSNKRTTFIRNYSGPRGRLQASLSPDMLTIHERPVGSFSRALHAARTRYPGWNIIDKFDNIPGEENPESLLQGGQHVLVAFMFMYHDHVMRHAVFLKDSGDNITHVEFYFDHLGDNPWPYFSFTEVTPGNYILIQNAQMHQFMDGQVGLRIDDPSQVHICSIDSLHQ